MEIHVRSREPKVGRSVRAFVTHRLERRLGRNSSRILRGTVHIADVNGPRGGEDKSVRIELQLLPRGSVFVEDTNANLFAAISRAAARAGHAVSKALERAGRVERGVGLRRIAPAHGLRAPAIRAPA